MKLSVVIPAHNEEGCIETTLRSLHTALKAETISHELLVVNDGSTDSTEDILRRLQQEIPELRYLNNGPSHGFGLAVRCGLE
ncbi:MAG: glycosyltransferase, partial [Candidatus Hydrogenedentes bacterium]|nr:glycosyltransferase [Candidatus Hydrogenedentota bacterium]